MSTQFESKHAAIMTGLYYAGRRDLYSGDNGETKSLDDILKNPEIKVVDDNISQFGYVHEDTLMIEFYNVNSVTCRIATTKFRDGFDLWFVEPESGTTMRI